MKIGNITIAREKYKHSWLVKAKLSYGKWIEYIDANQNYFTWYENTIDGIYATNHMHEVPENFKEGVLLSLNKKQALSDYNAKKGYYEIIIDFHNEFGIVLTNFQRKVKKKDLQILLEMATYLDAYLLNSGNKIIDEKFIEEYK